MSRYRWVVYVGCLLLVAGLARCSGQGSKGTSVTLKGSDTMVILGQRWAEKFMAAHPGATIQVTGGGSGTGIAALINGTTDICQSSRPMKQAEKDQLQKNNGNPGTEIVVAKDGLSVYLNEANTVTALTLGQIKDIYMGATTNWKQVGGKDAGIILYGRENSSGTYTYFKDDVLSGGDYAASMQTLPGTAAVVNAVARDPNGIGYGGAAYAKGVRECGIKKDDASPPVMPTEVTVHDGSYPISRGLFWYLRQEPKGPTKELVDFALSDEGQALVKEVGYFPIH